MIISSSVEYTDTNGVMHSEEIYHSFEAREPTWKKRHLIGTETINTEIRCDDTNAQCIV